MGRRLRGGRCCGYLDVLGCKDSSGIGYRLKICLKHKGCQGDDDI